MSHIDSEFLACINCLHTWCYRCAYHEYFLQSDNPPYQAIKTCRYCSTRFTAEQIDYFLGALNWGITHSYWDWCPATTVQLYQNFSVITAGSHSAIPVSWKHISLNTTEKKTYQHRVQSVLRPSTRRNSGNWGYRSWNTGTQKTPYRITKLSKPTENVRKILLL